jgi:hypothetical protein
MPAVSGKQTWTLTTLPALTIPMSETRFTRPTSLDAGIFLVRFAVLLTELLLTRIFSVTMYYHLSFMVVSLAMLGFGASGLVVTLAPGRFPEAKLFSQAARGAILFGVTAVAATTISFVLPISLRLSPMNWLRISAVYLACAVPFFFGGLVVSLILTLRSAQASRCYSFDLAGAALGCVAFIPATDHLGAPGAILFTATIAAIAGWILARGRDKRVASTGAIVAVCMTVCLLANSRLDLFNAFFVKGSVQSPTLALRWNSFSRVDVAGTPESLWIPHEPMFAGFSARLDPTFVIPEVRLLYDANASTPITYFDGDLRRMEYLRFDVSSSAYQIRRYREVLVIGPGGGRDILTALTLGSGPVTGVEINPITVDLMRNRFRTFTGGLYQDFPGVTVINDEARSFLRHQTRRFDLIEASVVDTWAASAAGAYALTENGLYTVEAFEDYFAHLAPDGVVAFNRWFSDPPFDSLKLVSIAREALSRRGVRNPADHIMAIHTDTADTLMPSLGSVLVKLSPFSLSEIAVLRRYATDMGFVLAYAPEEPGVARPGAPSQEQRDFGDLLGPRSSELLARYPYDIAPVFDDRPFFFNRTPIASWLASRLHISRSVQGAQTLSLGAQTLLISIVASGAGTLLLLFLPYLARRWRASKADPIAAGLQPPVPGAERSLLWATYFMGLGWGFILIEVVLIQRFSLFLGYPTYSLSVVLFTILLASALGSVSSGAFKASRLLPRAIGGLIILLLVYGAALPDVLSRTRGLSISLRICVAVATIAPLGLFMGVPFAGGVRAAGAESQNLVAWGWAINGGASVLGSAMAILISMAWGFSVAFLVGAGAYCLSLVAIIFLCRSGLHSRAASSLSAPELAGERRP